MNSNLRIEFDISPLPGSYTPITGKIDGIENFQITYREEGEGGSVASSYTSELTFYDDGYQYIKQFLIDSPNGFLETIAVKIYDACCNKVVFLGYIRGDSLDWCESQCYVTCNIINRDDITSCIQNKLIWDDTAGFLSKQYPKIRYCLQNRPIFLQVLIDIVASLLLLIAGIILTIIAGLLFITFNPGAAQDILDFRNKIRAALLPCGLFHPSPYIRDYINNVCNICGLTFQSSILNDSNSAYYNTVLFSAQVRKGRLPNDPDGKLILDNKPLETLVSLFDNYLNLVFNAKYKIRNNILYFERKDYFNTGNQWIDTEQLLNEGRLIDGKVCYTWQDRTRYSFARFEYQGDAMEYIGNEYLPYYNDIVEWNPNGNPAQKGEYVVSLPLSPARFVGDAETNEIDLTYAGQGVPGLGISYDGVLLMAQHNCFTYKFLIIDPATSKVVNYFPDWVIGGDIPGTKHDERFNYPYWFVEGRDGNLYSNFHYIDDPRSSQNTNFDFKFTFQFTCQEFADFEFGKNVRLIRGGQQKFGQIKEIQVDFNNRTIQVTGVVN